MENKMKDFGLEIANVKISIINEILKIVDKHYDLNNDDEIEVELSAAFAVSREDGSVLIVDKIICTSGRIFVSGDNAMNFTVNSLKKIYEQIYIDHQDIIELSVNHFAMEDDKGLVCDSNTFIPDGMMVFAIATTNGLSRSFQTYTVAVWTMNQIREYTGLDTIPNIVEVGDTINYGLDDNDKPTMLVTRIA